MEEESEGASHTHLSRANIARRCCCRTREPFGRQTASDEKEARVAFVDELVLAPL